MSKSPNESAPPAAGGPKKATQAFAGVAALTLVAGGGLVFWLNGHIRDGQAAVASKEAEVGSSEQVAKRLDATKATYDQMNSRVAFLEASVAEKAYVPTLLQQFQTLAAATHLTVATVQPSAQSRPPPRRLPPPKAAEAPSPPGPPRRRPRKRSPRPPYDTMNVSLSVVGTYADTVTFLYDLTQFPKILSVESAQFSPGGGASQPGMKAVPQVTTQLKLTAFVFHDDGGPAPQSGADGPQSWRSRAASGGPDRGRGGGPGRAGRGRRDQGRQRPQPGRRQHTVAREKSMGFQKIDKKQLPQVIGLGAASAGMFGYFAFKMIAPTASAAPAPPPAKTVTAASAAGAPAVLSGDATASAVDAPPPTPGMHDPFIPAISDKAGPRRRRRPRPARMRRTASTAGIGSADALPVPPPCRCPRPARRRTRRRSAARSDRSPPMPIAGVPAPLAPPAWTVTGVLRSGDEQVAILRSGDGAAVRPPGRCRGRGLPGGGRDARLRRAAPRRRPLRPPAGRRQAHRT